MNESKKIKILGLIIGIILLICIGSSIFKGNGKYIYYFCNNEDDYCDVYKDIISYVSDTYNIKYKYINIDNYSNDEIKNYLDKYNIDSNDFGIPLTVLVKKNKAVDKVIGLINDKILYNLLKENDFVKDEYVTRYTYIKDIDLNEYKNIKEKEGKTLLVLAQSSCIYCNKAKPYINDIAKENNIEINYIDVLITNNNEYDIFYNSYDYIKEAIDNDELATPTFLIIDNGEIKDYLSGFKNKESLEEFLTKNDVI